MKKFVAPHQFVASVFFAGNHGAVDGGNGGEAQAQHDHNQDSPDTEG